MLKQRKVRMAVEREYSPQIIRKITEDVDSEVKKRATLLNDKTNIEKVKGLKDIYEFLEKKGESHSGSPRVTEYITGMKKAVELAIRHIIKEG